MRTYAYIDALLALPPTHVCGFFKVGTFIESIKRIQEACIATVKPSEMPHFIIRDCTVALYPISLFKYQKNKRPHGLPLDIRLSRLHLKLRAYFAHSMTMTRDREREIPFFTILDFVET